MEIDSPVGVVWPQVESNVSRDPWGELKLSPRAAVVEEIKSPATERKPEEEVRFWEPDTQRAPLEVLETSNTERAEGDEEDIRPRLTDTALAEEEQVRNSDIERSPDPTFQIRFRVPDRAQEEVDQRTPLECDIVPEEGEQITFRPRERAEVEEGLIRFSESVILSEEEEQMASSRDERAVSEQSEERDLDEMEVETPGLLAVVQATAERGLAFTEEQLRKSVQSNSHAVLARAAEKPISEIDIPLCRMVAMTEVRKPLEVDIQKLRAEFTRGYRRGGPAFYVATKSYGMEETNVTAKMRKGWSKLWQKADKDFELLLKSNPDLVKFSNKMFHVWDGNHRLLAWYPLIEWNHMHDPAFHVPVKSIVLNISGSNRKEILHAMTDWNK